MANRLSSHLSLDWDKLIKDYRASGKSSRAWCEEQGFNTNQLRYQMVKRSKLKEKKETIFFHPVEIIPELTVSEANTSYLSLLIGKMELRISEGFQPSLLVEVVKALQPIC